MKLQEIEQRGKPPYKVWNGGEGRIGVRQHTPTRLWVKALELFHDQTNHGRDLIGQTIQDATGEHVFSADSEHDVSLIRQITGW